MILCILKELYLTGLKRLKFRKESREKFNFEKVPNQDKNRIKQFPGITIYCYFLLIIQLNVVKITDVRGINEDKFNYITTFTF